MNKLFYIVLILINALFTSCDIEQTRSFKLPKVNITPGHLPTYQIHMANLELPAAIDQTKISVRIDLELRDSIYEIEIMEMLTDNKNLYVISKLISKNKALNDISLMLTKQVSVNAPDHLEIEHYIIGKQPVGINNDQYNYFESIENIPSKIIKNRSIIWNGKK